MSNTLDNLRASAASLRAAASKPEGAGFSLDAWHAMEDRDNALVADGLMHGAMSSAFVYSFTGDDGQPATGISVVGARHLAAHYGGIKHRIVWTVDKRGSRSTMMTQPHGDTPAACKVIYEKSWEDEPDWYRCTVEVTDIKNGNSLQVTMEESREGRRKDGSTFLKPHYATIAESKAFRNAVLDLIPQDLTMAFKQKALALGRSEDLTADVIGAKRDHVIAYATSRAITINRKAVQDLSFAQIAGLSEAARSGGLDSFHASLSALGLLHFADAAPPAAPPASPPTSLSPRERGEGSAVRTKPTPRAKAAPPPPPEPGTTSASLRADTPDPTPPDTKTAESDPYIRDLTPADLPPLEAVSAPSAASTPPGPQLPTRSRRTPAPLTNGTTNPSLAFGGLE